MLSRDEAWNLLREYNQESFHLRHALTVEGVMKYFAKELGYENEEASYKDMETYYSKQKQKEYGVVGIKIKK